jgi:hypothetical protein
MPAVATGTAVPGQGRALLVPLVEVAALLARPVDAVRQMIRRGQLPAPASGGGQHGAKQFWRRSDLDLWVRLGCPDRRTFEEARDAATNQRKLQ